MTKYEICVLLKKDCFFQSRKRDAYYFITPEYSIMLDDIDSLLDSKQSQEWADPNKLVYIPTTQDFIDYLAQDLQQIQRMADYTFFSYVEQDYEGQDAYRAPGETVWESLANVILTRNKMRRDVVIDNVKKSEDHI